MISSAAHGVMLKTVGIGKTRSSSVSNAFLFAAEPNTGE
jgi:hypothetical protein